mgnify:CR=1 FL=1
MTTPALRRSLARLRRAAESYGLALDAARGLALAAVQAELPGVVLTSHSDGEGAEIVWHSREHGLITIACEGHVWRVTHDRETDGGPTVRTALARLAACGPEQRAAVGDLLGGVEA